MSGDSKDAGLDWLKENFPDMAKYVEAVKQEERAILGGEPPSFETTAPKISPASSSSPKRSAWSWLDKSQLDEKDDD